MNELELIIDLHADNNRQGPGSDTETERAIGLARLDPHSALAIADIGCGTGASSRVLARSLSGHITAIDSAKPFLDRMRVHNDREGLAERITTVETDMASLPFEQEQFDLIWSEGAIYNIGFARGLRAWRRFLYPRGVIAVSELTWTTSTRPDAVDEYWKAEYPGIGTALEKLRIIEDEGYEPLGVFVLPRCCWEEHYYAPLEAGFDRFLRRHHGNPIAAENIRNEQAEIDFYKRNGDWYGYTFFIARKRDDRDESLTRNI